jgi:hypothetical protein
MPETQDQPTTSFDAPKFRALFVESLEPERVPFTITKEDGSELECWVDLLPMGDSDLDRYQTLGIDYEANESGKFKLTGVDQEARKRFLLTRTVLAWEVWERQPKKGGGLTDWQLSRLPENERERHAMLEKRKLTGDFGPWLVGECERVNGMTKDQAGN